MLHNYKAVKCDCSVYNKYLSQFTDYIYEGVRIKRSFFVFRPSSQDQKGLSDSNKLLIPLACEILLK